VNSELPIRKNIGNGSGDTTQRIVNRYASKKKAYAAKYRATHSREARLAYNRRYYRDNRPSLTRYAKAYHRAHREERKEYSRKRYQRMMEALRKIGRPRKDLQRLRVEELRALGLEWPQLTVVMNKEFKESCSIESYRALLRNRAR